MNETLLEYVLAQLDSRRGTWPAIARAIEPESPDSYYSWLTKLAQRRIPDPSVNKIQVLADFFRGNEREVA